MLAPTGRDLAQGTCAKIAAAGDILGRSEPGSCGEEDAEVSHNFNRGYNRIVTLAQQGKISLSSNLILFDSYSMCSVCNDRCLLHKVLHFKEHRISQGMRIVSMGMG